MLDLVIFDCDGVLVDSEIIACRVLAEMVGHYVPQIDQARFAAESVGRTNDAILSDLSATYNAPFPDDMKAQVRLAIDKDLAANLQPVTGATAMLGALTLPRAVASNSHSDRLMASLTKTNLLRHFNEHVFGVDRVPNPKPAPDLYQLALEMTGVAAERAVVVEDSLTGLTAARAAGLSVIGFIGASGVADGQTELLMDAGASIVIDTLAALPALLSEGGQF